MHDDDASFADFTRGIRPLKQDRADTGKPRADLGQVAQRRADATRTTTAIRVDGLSDAFVIDVGAEVRDGRVEVAVRDYGRWRERVPSMDRGRGSMLMSAVGEITATPSPAGTTVVIRSGPPLPSGDGLR